MPIPASTLVDRLLADAGLPNTPQYRAVVFRSYALGWTTANDTIRDVLVVEPCHITGMHDPVHTPRYLCTEQQAKVLAQVLTALNRTVDMLPKRLHASCAYCGTDADATVPVLEYARSDRRALYAWAGVEIPAGLADTGR